MKTHLKKWNNNTGNWAKTKLANNSFDNLFVESNKKNKQPTVMQTIFLQ